jgi:hypothetical protein
VAEPKERAERNRQNRNAMNLTIMPSSPQSASRHYCALPRLKNIGLSDVATLGISVVAGIRFTLDIHVQCTLSYLTCPPSISYLDFGHGHGLGLWRMLGFGKKGFITILG